MLKLNKSFTGIPCGDDTLLTGDTKGDVSSYPSKSATRLKRRQPSKNSSVLPTDAIQPLDDTGDDASTSITKPKNTAKRHPSSNFKAHINPAVHLKSGLEGVASNQGRKTVLKTKQHQSSGVHPKLVIQRENDVNSDASRGSAKPIRIMKHRSNSKTGSHNAGVSHLNIRARSEETKESVRTTVHLSPRTNSRKKSTETMRPSDSTTSSETEAAKQDMQSTSAPQSLTNSKSPPRLQSKLVKTSKRKKPTKTSQPETVTTSSVPISEDHPPPEAQNSQVSTDHDSVASSKTISKTKPVVEDNGVDMRFVDPVILAIRGEYKKFAIWQQAGIKMTLRMSAICRAFVGARDKGDKAGLKRAAELQARVEKQNQTPEEEVVAITCIPLMAARDALEPYCKATKKSLEKMVKGLPISAWVEEIPGLGLFSMAKILGETGAPGAYRSVSALWKRMGLAVIDGERQRRVPGADATKHGYNPKRRAVIWNVGKQICNDMKRPKLDEDLDAREGLSKYERMFLKRLRVEVTNHVEHARKPVERDGVMYESFSKQAAARAKRYVEKMFLKDLWVWWRAQERTQ